VTARIRAIPPLEVRSGEATQSLSHFRLSR